MGNSRVSYTEGTNGNAQVVEENSYYAFGLQHKGYGAAPTGLGNAHAENYKYNSKELNEELGLNMYDYGARNYDPAIGRWMNVDPLAEVSRRWSPYTYAFDNPVFFIDDDGMQADWFGKKAEKQARATEKKIDKKIAELNKGNAADKNDRIAQLNKSKADISDMRNDKIMSTNLIRLLIIMVNLKQNVQGQMKSLFIQMIFQRKSMKTDMGDRLLGANLILIQVAR